MAGVVGADHKGVQPGLHQPHGKHLHYQAGAAFAHQKNILRFQYMAAGAFQFKRVDLFYQRG